MGAPARRLRSSDSSCNCTELYARVGTISRCSNAINSLRTGTSIIHPHRCVCYYLLSIGAPLQTEEVQCIAASSWMVNGGSKNGEFLGHLQEDAGSKKGGDILLNGACMADLRTVRCWDTCTSKLQSSKKGGEKERAVRY